MRKFLALTTVLVALAACTYPQSQRETLFQASTLNAVMLGVYDGEVTCQELKMRGDIGIGTFDALDGEMVMLDGDIYQVRGDGKVILADDDWTSPLAVVTRFDVDHSISLRNVESTAEFYQQLEASMSNRNIFYVVRIDGRFSYVKTRSVPRQQKPYPPLAEVAKTQPVFEFRDVEGTLVGVWYPQYAQGVNMAGFHMHFLTKDKTGGGHVLECQPLAAVARFDHTNNMYLVLPQHDAFARAGLSSVDQDDYHGVEK